MSGSRPRARTSRQHESNGLHKLENEQGIHLSNEDEVTPYWTQEEAKRFFEAFQEHSFDWTKVSRGVRSKSPKACEALYRNFRSFLSLPKHLLNVKAFLAVVKDSLKLEDSDDATISDNHSEPSDGNDSGIEVTQVSKGARLAHTPLKRSGAKAVSPARRVKDASNSPVWGIRRPRARQSRVSPRASPGQVQYNKDRGKFMSGQSSAELGDADGIDALLSLAAVAQEASYGNDPGEREGRPARTLKRPRRHIEESEDDGPETSPRGLRTASRDMHSPPSQRQQARPTGQQMKSPAMDPMPPRTPSSRSKREKPQPASNGAKGTGATAEPAKRDSGPARRMEGGAAKPAGSGSGLRHSSRSRRRNLRDDDDEDYQVKPNVKRSRRIIATSEEAQQVDEESEEANLQAEKEDLEDEEDEDYDWSRRHAEPMPRKRQRKSAPEKAPPMMASAKALLSKRSNVGFNMPAPAFLLGVPPSNAQLSGVETEGQTSMGLAEVRLRHCLDPRVRRWCSYEFFCSALDRAWFMRNELADYLSHVGIPQGTRLARPELAIIRASLGSPRRLSLSYLRQERIKLEAWREKVRSKYAELGPGAEVPADFPRQLQVGQKVTARHPITRQLHDGDVLTVAANSYRVQFDRRELGVELIKDIDLMPTDPTECLPAALLQVMPQVLLNGRQPGKEANRSAQQFLMLAPSLSWPAAATAKGAAVLGSMPAPPAAPAFPTVIRNLTDMKTALDMKEMLLARLKRMNDEVDAGMHKEENGQRPAAFQKAYAQILLDLQNMNKLLDSSPFSMQPIGPVTAPVSAAALPQSVPQAVPQSTAEVQPSAAPPVTVTSPPRPAPANIVKIKPTVRMWESAWKEATKMVEEVRSHLTNASKEPEEVDTALGAREQLAAGEAPAAQEATEMNRGSAKVQETQPELREEEWVSNMVNGCVSLLIALHKCSEEPQPPAGVDAVLENALKAVTPLSNENQPLFDSIQKNVASLKLHLLASCNRS